MSPATTKATYSVSEAARLLGISPGKLRKLIESGEFRAIKAPGGHIVVPGSSIREWVGEGQTAAETVDTTVKSVEITILRAQLVGVEAQAEVLRSRINQLEAAR